MWSRRFLPQLILVLIPVAIFGGSLNPPGSPAPSMRPIGEIEPRVVISSATTPGDVNSLFRITSPGSYYLGGNVAGVAGKHGIKIMASGVTIDLLGFTMVGGAGSLGGIVTDGVRHNLVIRDGIVRNWDRSGIDLTQGGMGNGSVVTGIRAEENSGYGIRTNENSILRDCFVRGQLSGVGYWPPYHGSGIYADAGSTIVNCVAIDNETYGFVVGTNSTVRDCISNGHRSNGVNTLFNVTIMDCVAISNRYGIFAGYGSNIANCVANGNSTCGFCFEKREEIGGGGSQLKDSLSAGNQGGGALGICADLSDDCLVQGCAFIDSDFGIWGSGEHNVILGNHVLITKSNALKKCIILHQADNFTSNNTLLFALSEIRAGNFWGCLYAPHGTEFSGDSGGASIEIEYIHMNWYRTLY